MKTKNLFGLIVLVGSLSSISVLIVVKEKHVVEETAHFMASGKKREMEVEGSQHLPQGNFPTNLTSIRILLLEIPWHSQEHHKLDVYRIIGIQSIDKTVMMIKKGTYVCLYVCMYVMYVF